MAAPCPSEVAFLTSAARSFDHVGNEGSRCRGSASGLKAWILQVLPPSWRTQNGKRRLDSSPVEQGLFGRADAVLGKGNGIRSSTSTVSHL